MLIRFPPLVRALSLRGHAPVGAGVVLVAELVEPAVERPAVDVDAGAGCDGVLHEAAQGVGGGVTDDLHPQPTGTCAPDLDGDDHQRLGAALPAASQPVLEAANEALIDLDRSGQRCAFRINHCAAQLVQHHPRGLVALDSELALELNRRDARGSGSHQVRGPEPQVQRRPGAMKDGTGGQRDLVAAG